MHVKLSTLHASLITAAESYQRESAFGQGVLLKRARVHYQSICKLIRRNVAYKYQRCRNEPAQDQGGRHGGELFVPGSQDY